MTKDSYMALADLQSVWDDTIKPWITSQLTYSAIGYDVATAADNGNTSGAITLDGSKPLYVITLTGAVSSLAFTSNKLPAAGHSCHVIFTASTATTASIAHDTSGSVKYICPDGSSPSPIDVPAGGYAEVDLLRIDKEDVGGTVSYIYVRGV